jgi:hypothetical protein
VQRTERQASSVFQLPCLPWSQQLRIMCVGSRKRVKDVVAAVLLCAATEKYTYTCCYIINIIILFIKNNILT